MDVYVCGIIHPQLGSSIFGQWAVCGMIKNWKAFLGPSKRNQMTFNGMKGRVVNVGTNNINLY